MSGIAAIVILVVVLSALWVGARRHGNAERSRREHREADLALLAKRGIRPPPSAAEGCRVGLLPLVVGGIGFFVLMAAVPLWGKCVVAAGGVALLWVFVFQPSHQNHQRERERAMTQAVVAVSELPPEAREAFVDAFTRTWRGELTPSMRSLSRTTS